MIPVKRLEIVVDAPYSEKVVRVLERHGIEGWTLLRGASGQGDRGLRLGDEITGVSNNNILVSTCPPEKLDALVTDVRKILERYGGMCLVSDALWLRH